ncbi:MAG: hypothetical protein K2K12_00370, partial [Clostridia bacterium]|nr:hypothetical protein [Clostridia bacterium]
MHFLLRFLYCTIFDKFCQSFKYYVRHNFTFFFIKNKGECRKMGILRGAMFIIGTSIGAGFLSGAELVRFFHTEHFFYPVMLSAFFFFLVSTFYLHLGKKYGGFAGALNALFGRGAKAIKIIISLSSFIPCAGMLAGLDALLPSL